MVDTAAFHSDVIAYPAITIIAREKGNKTRVAHRPEINAAALSKLEAALLAAGDPPDGSGVRELPGVAAGADPWILESSDQLAVVRRLEAEFPTLEEAGCKVGIGVATGADKAFIGPFDELDVEPNRKLPLVDDARHLERRGRSGAALASSIPSMMGAGSSTSRHYPRLSPTWKRGRTKSPGVTSPERCPRTGTGRSTASIRRIAREAETADPRHQGRSAYRL